MSAVQTHLLGMKFIAHGKEYVIAAVGHDDDAWSILAVYCNPGGITTLHAFSIGDVQFPAVPPRKTERPPPTAIPGPGIPSRGG